MPSTDPPVLVRRDGALLVLILNRPDRLNAVSLPLYRSLLEALEAASEDPDLRAVILTGSGRGFCVGADLKAHGKGRPNRKARETYVHAAQEVNRRIQEHPLPVVAAVNGHAVGAGLELALSADFAVANESAKLRLPEAALGTFVGGGVTYTLPRRVGLAQARRLLLLCAFVTGREAAEIGLVDVAVPGGEVMERARSLADELAGKAPLSLRLIRELLGRAHRLDRGEALDEEARALLRCMETADWEEGVRAYHEEREPRFTGE